MTSLQTSNARLEKSIQKLSTGRRINSAADDAAGLAISEKMEAEISSLEQAKRNAEDAISFLETGDSALSQSTDILQRMKELVFQSQNRAVLTESERSAISTELSALRDELDRISVSTTFNTKPILDGSFAESGATFHIGTSSSDVDSVSVEIGDMSSKGLARNGSERISIDISSVEEANETLDDLDYALSKISEQRALFGAVDNRLDYTIENLSLTEENLYEAKSRITDVDMAEETINYTKEEMINRSAILMLSQANTQARNVMTLLDF